jgi:prepilin signal peptidase PulO-like enzyme (type II secretory pathway)
MFAFDDVFREIAILFGLIIGAIWDIKKREICGISLFFIVIAGIIGFNIQNLFESIVILVLFCIWIMAKKDDIGVGGGDVWIIVTLTFATGLLRTSAILFIGFLILIIHNIIVAKKIKVKKEIEMVPFMAAGHIVVLSIIAMVTF